MAGRQLIMVFLDSAGKYSRIGDAERVRRWITASVPAAVPAALEPRTSRRSDASAAGAARQRPRQPRCPRLAEICAAVARSRSSHASSSRSAGAEIDRPATSLPWSSRMPAAMQRTPSSSSSSSRAVPYWLHPRQLALEPRQLGDAVARVAGQAGARRVGADALRVVVGEEELADRRQMQRRTPADGANDLHSRPFAVGALDVDDLVALAHREVDRLVRQLVQLAHRAERRVANVEPRLDQVAELEQAHAEAVAARLGPVDEAADRQVVEDAVRGRRVQPALLADRLERDRLLVRREQVEQAEGTLEHLDRDAAVLVFSSCRILARSSGRRGAAAMPLRTAPSSVAGNGPSR